MNKALVKKISTILIWSEDFRQLSKWYQDILGFPVIEEIDHPQDTGILLDTGKGSPALWIGKHSEVHGKNQDPNRIMMNLSVDSVSETYQLLVSKGVRFLGEPFKAPTFDSYFATFYDLDGNTLQLIGGK